MDNIIPLRRYVGEFIVPNSVEIPPYNILTMQGLLLLFLIKF